MMLSPVNKLFDVVAGIKFWFEFQFTKNEINICLLKRLEVGLIKKVFLSCGLVPRSRIPCSQTGYRVKPGMTL
jgi:hypothetical protein